MVNFKHIKCTIPGCSNKHQARGYCDMHYRRFRNYGDPLMVRTAIGAPKEFFTSVVLGYKSDDCLLWKYSCSTDGCGVLFLDGKTHRLPRLICTIKSGAPPTSKHEAAHSCGNGHLGCVNPNHLRWATHAENMRDRDAHGTTSRGERAGTAKLRDDQVRAIKSMAGLYSYQSIADRFGVGPTTISRIHSGKTWRHVS